MDVVDSNLLTIQQATANLLSFLRNLEISEDEAHAESRLILEHCLEIDLAKQLTHGTQILTLEQVACINSICKKRKERMPLQYCLGYAYFWKMKLGVMPGVFIPRGDTESLVEVALRKIKTQDRGITLADIGTGSGAVAIALARELPAAKIMAIDINPTAISLAKKNAEVQGVTAQIDFVTGSWIEVLPDGLDFIVSNPPYLNDLHRESMAPEITRYEPESALYGPGTDGLGFYQELAEHCPKHLKKDGKILLEIGDGQSQTIEQMFKAFGWEQIELHKDLNKLTRAMSAQRV